MPLRIALFVASMALFSVAFAETPAPAAAPLPKPSCGAKPDHPGHLASDHQKRTWQKEANDYLDCLKKFAMAQQATAEAYLKLANATIDEYNATAKEFQEAAQKASGR